MNLTNEQQRFVEEYLIDLNATQSALRAGYSSEEAPTVGFEFLKNPRVAAQISEAKQSRIKRETVSQGYVIEKIAETIERGLQRPVFEESANGGLVEGWRRKFDAVSILKGCELLGKHLGMFQDKVADTHDDGLCDKCRRTANLTDEELTAELSELFRGLRPDSD